MRWPFRHPEGSWPNDAHADGQPDALAHQHLHPDFLHAQRHADHHRDANRIPHALRATFGHTNSHQQPDANLYTDSDFHRHFSTHADRHAHAGSSNQHPYSPHSDLDQPAHGSADQPAHGDGYLWMTHMPLDARQLLLELSPIPGPSGFEAPICEKLHKIWSPYADSIEVSPLGNLYALRRGKGPEPRRRLALAAHMDTIGLIVKDIVGDGLRVSALGIPDPRVLLGQRVKVLAEDPLPGLVVRPPDSCLPKEAKGRAARIEELMVDLGLPANELAEHIQIGTPVVLDQPVVSVDDGRLAGPSFDNRASLAALTITLERLAHLEHEWDVWVIATVQEELFAAGAATAGFQLEPDLAIVVDTTFGRGPSHSGAGTFSLGGGVTNGWGPSVHPWVNAALEAAADRLASPVTREVLPTLSSTDADRLQTTAAGIPTGLVSLPIRNMHSAVEVIDPGDIEAAAALLAAFSAGLTVESTADLPGGLAS